MSPTPTIKSLVVVFSIAGLAGVAVSVADAQAEAVIPGIEVTAELPDVVYQGELFSVHFEMRNIGEQQYSEVVFEPTDACGPSSVMGIVEFTELSGNDDARFDPGEVWSFLAPRCLDSAVPFAGVELSVASIEPEGYYVFPYQPSAPLAVAATIGQVTADLCDPNQYSVAIKSLTTTDLTLDSAALQLIPAGATPAPEFVVADASLDGGSMTELSGDGDGLIDPMETWDLTFNMDLGCTVLTADPPFDMVLSMSGRTVDASTNEDLAGWCFGTEFSCNRVDDAWNMGTVIGVTGDVEATSQSVSSSEQESTLPYTGSSIFTPTILACLLLVSGVVAHRAGRRR